MFSDVQREPPVFQWLPTCHWGPLERACLCSPCPLVSCVNEHWPFCSPGWTAPVLSAHPHRTAAQVSLSYLWSFARLSILKYVHVFLVLGSQEIDISLPVSQNNMNHGSYKWDINVFDSEKFRLYLMRGNIFPVFSVCIELWGLEHCPSESSLDKLAKS